MFRLTSVKQGKHGHPGRCLGDSRKLRRLRLDRRACEYRSMVVLDADVVPAAHLDSAVRCIHLYKKSDARYSICAHGMHAYRMFDARCRRRNQASRGVDPNRTPFRCCFPRWL